MNSGYAAEEKGRAEHLSQVAAADEAAAARAEAEYLRLKAIYEAEKKKSTPHDQGPHKTKHPPKPKDPGDPGTPPAPNLPPHNGTPPADQGPDVQRTPPAPPFGLTDITPPAYQGPTIDADSGDGTPAEGQGGGAEANLPGSGETSDEPNPWAKPLPEEDPPRDTWIARTGPPLEPVHRPDTDNPTPPKGPLKKAIWILAQIARVIHNINSH